MTNFKLQPTFRILAEPISAIGVRIREGALQCAENRQCPSIVETFNPGSIAAFQEGTCLGICGLFSKQLLEAAVLYARSFPVINVSNRFGAISGLGNFLSNDTAVGKLAAEHLLERGYKHFLIIAEANRKFAEERVEGFQNKLATAAFSCDLIIRDFQTDQRSQPLPAFTRKIEEELRPVFQRMPMDVAIFATNDWLAMLMQRVLMQNYPERVHTTAVLGVDDQQHAHWYLGPLAGLSSVRPAFHAIGAAAMEWLIEHPGDCDAILSEETRRFAPEKVVGRASTAGGACADPITARMLRWAWQAMQDGNKVQVSDLAVQFKTSRRSLDRRFMLHLGMGAGDYLRVQRLDMAVHLLRNTNLTIAEISQQCGYSKQDTLSTVFRKAYGQTPMEFRRQGKVHSASAPTGH